VLPDIAHEFDRAEGLKPVGVVDDAHVIPEDPRQLRCHGARIRRNRLRREQRTLGRLAARVADERRPAARQRDDPVSALRNAKQSHRRHQIADVKRCGSRVESAVRRDDTRRQMCGQPLRVLVEESAGAQRVEER
jgi:hypothetical protein